jgi:hypothetical protein
MMGAVEGVVESVGPVAGPFAAGPVQLTALDLDRVRT